MSENDSAPGSFTAGNALQPFHEVGIGETVKAKTLNALFVESAWNWQNFGNTRHVTVKGGIEAGDLRDLRMLPMEQTHQLKAGRQMFGIVRAEAVQFVNEFAGK